MIQFENCETIGDFAAILKENGFKPNFLHNRKFTKINLEKGEFLFINGWNEPMIGNEVTEATIENGTVTFRTFNDGDRIKPNHTALVTRSISYYESGGEGGELSGFGVAVAEDGNGTLRGGSFYHNFLRTETVTRLEPVCLVNGETYVKTGRFDMSWVNVTKATEKDLAYDVHNERDSFLSRLS